MTPAQLQALNSELRNDPLALGYAPYILDGSYSPILDLLNAPTAGFWVWKTSLSTDEVYNQVVWTNLTPNDDATNIGLSSQLIAEQVTARALICQAKQLNLQIMLQGRTAINPSKQKVRDGLQDALTNLPTGNNGNPRQAGWTALQLILSRLATRGEQVLASGGTGASQADPATMGYEGPVSLESVRAALAL